MNSIDYLYKKPYIYRSHKSYILKIKEYLIIISEEYTNNILHVIYKNKPLINNVVKIPNLDFSDQDFKECINVKYHLMSCYETKEYLNFPIINPCDILALLLYTINVNEQIICEYVKILIEYYDLLWYYESNSYSINLAEYRLTVNRDNIILFKSDNIIKKFNHNLAKAIFSKIDYYNSIKPDIKYQSETNDYNVYELKLGEKNGLCLRKMTWQKNMDKKTAFDFANKLISNQFKLVVIKGIKSNLHNIIWHKDIGEIIYIVTKLFDGSVYTEEKIGNAIEKKWSAD